MSEDNSEEDAVIFEQLTEEEIKELQAIFDLVDRNRCGSISPEGLQTLMTMVGLHTTKEELQKIVDEIDENNDGKIQFDEFVAVMSKKVSISYKANEIIESFQLFATESPNGFISVNELKTALTKYGDTKILNENFLKYIENLEFDENGLFNYQNAVNLIMIDD